MADPWIRTEIPDFGRSLNGVISGVGPCSVIARRKGYDVTTSAGTVRVRDFTLAQFGWQVPVPTDDDLAWLRGEQ